MHHASTLLSMTDSREVQVKQGLIRRYRLSRLRDSVLRCIVLGYTITGSIHSVCLGTIDLFFFGFQTVCDLE